MGVVVREGFPCRSPGPASTVAQLLKHSFTTCDMTEPGVEDTVPEAGTITQPEQNSEADAADLISGAAIDALHDAPDADGSDSTPPRSSSNKIAPLSPAGSAGQTTEGGPAPVNRKKACAQFMDGMFMTLVMILATLVSLCAPDLLVWGTDRSSDETIAWINMICFVLFLLEWIINSVVMTKDTGFPPYLCGFFWWMDAAATFSMIGDIYFLAQVFAPPSTGGAKMKNMKAGKLIKLGRTTKLLRVLRIVRMIKLIKLALKGKEETEEELAAKAEEEAIADKGSVVGQKLAQKTTLNVLLGILLMMFVLPFLNYDAEDNSFAWGFDQLRRINNQARMTSSADAFKDFLSPQTSPNAAFEKNPEGQVVLRQLMYMKLKNGTATYTFALPGWEEAYDKLRTNERLILEAQLEGGAYATVEYAEIEKLSLTTSPYEVSTADILAMNNTIVLSRRSVAIQESYFSFVLIMFIMVMLLGSSAFFNADANLLVVGPIENMVKRISDMQADPLGLNADIEAEQVRIATEKKKMAEDNDPKLKAKREAEEAKQAAAEAKQAKKKKKKKPEQYETAMLNNTIGRIQQLLRVGFGSAGGEIVAKNLLAAEAGEAPKVASKFGLRVYGIWGFCIIEDFNEILVALDDDIMTFVNCVAGMVHTEVGKNKGAVNKNIGEAFLLTWKTKPATDPLLKNEDGTPFNELDFVQGKVCDPATGKMIDEGTKEYYFDKLAGGGLPGLDQQEAAECALRSCKAIAEKLDTEMDDRLNSALCKPGSFGAAPDQRKTLLEVLRTSDVIPNSRFRVHMGVGLNYGWGIEGAIGSEHKVDASYLSPNVNTAARLETANHQFGTKMLISLNVVKMMSQKCQDSLRCVECVRPKGVAIGIRIHTSDQIQMLKDPLNPNPALRLEKYLPPRATQEFQDLYREGFDAYFQGEWPKAKELMDKCAAMDPGDVPTQVILKQMSDRGNTWKDYWVTKQGEIGSGRALTSK